MAAPVEDEGYEYDSSYFQDQIHPLTCSASYEALPPNFSLAANMAAGAFAGIAVGEHNATRKVCLWLNNVRNTP